MSHTREQYVFLAKLAEQAERYDGMEDTSLLIFNYVYIFRFSFFPFVLLQKWFPT